MPRELDAPAVQQALARELGAGHGGRGGFIWVEDGNEVVVWPGSLSVRLEPGTIRVRVDLETEQTGRAPQEVVIAVAQPSEAPSLIAVSHETARGDARLTARWGR